MKLLPLAVALAFATLLIGCNSKPAADTTEPDRDAQERLAEEKLAQEESQLHERQAALDEQERLIEQKSRLLAVASATPGPLPPIASAPPVAAAPPASQAPPAQPSAPSADATYGTFYNTLASFGAWYHLNDYGDVWQPAPSLTGENWRPYTIGHWVYTDEGWTWVSDEPFGWITYHYGRWMRISQLGWVWTPGDEWAPAWVSWRYGNDYVGWAPLPPEATFNPSTGIQQWADQQYDLGAGDYTFVPASDFGEGNMADVEVPSDQAGPIYDESNNETNIYYDTGSYAIICYGPNYDFMRSKARRHLPPPLRITRGGFHSGGKNTPVVTGGSLQVAAPRILQPRTPVSAPVRGNIAGTRLVSPPPALHTAGGGAPVQPLYPPPRRAAAAAAPGVPAIQTVRPGPVAEAGAPPPSRPSMAAQSFTAPASVARPQPPNTSQPYTPEPSRPAGQTERDLQVIQQQQALQEMQRKHQEADAARAAQEERAQQLRAQEAAETAARAASEQRAAQAEAAAREQAVRQQAAQQEAARVESARAAQLQPAVPAGSQQGGPGRNQQ